MLGYVWKHPDMIETIFYIPTPMLYKESMIQRNPHNSNQRLFWVLHTSSYHREQSYVQKSRSTGSERPPNLNERKGQLWPWLGIGSMGQETLLYFYFFSVSSHSHIISNLCIIFLVGVPAKSLYLAAESFHKLRASNASYLVMQIAFPMSRPPAAPCCKLTVSSFDCLY